MRAAVTTAATALALALGPARAAADEGMWTFDNLPIERLRAEHGFAPDAAWLEHVRLASARTSNCSAGFVSARGLVMTNHHCARSCIEDLSRPGADLIVQGFVARTPAAELRCPGEHVDQLVEIRDVTAQVTGATSGKAGAAAAAARRTTLAALEKACATDARTHCQVVALYRGGLYHLYRYRRYDDVRLVFAPEEAIAFFGGDPDNYEFPRWNYDVAFLRAYEDGQPAATPTHLRWSRGGPREGELIFISGNPGRTSRLLTVAQLVDQRDRVIPAWGLALAEKRGFLAEYQQRGPEQRRTAAGPLFGTENNLKRARGQFRMLTDPAFFAARVAAEKDLRERVAADPELARRHGAAWDDIERALAGYLPYRAELHLLEDSSELTGTATWPGGFDSRLFRIARTLERGAAERRRPAARRLRELQDANLPALERDLLSEAPIYPELEIATLAFSLARMRERLGPDHPVVRRLLGAETPGELAARVVGGTKLADVAVRKRLWQDGRAVAAARATDPMLALAAAVDGDARAVRRRFEDGYQATVTAAAERIAAARFAVYGTSHYPDATFTPRLAFGVVAGYQDDGRAIPAMTRVAGLWRRATGRPPTELPASWIAARRKLVGDLPFNFVATPDSVGGNSGSPAINRAGEIVGLYFDQNIHGTATPFGYDEVRRRGVFLHSELITRALLAVYGARELAAELRRR